MRDGPWLLAFPDFSGVPALRAWVPPSATPCKSHVPLGKTRRASDPGPDPFPEGKPYKKAAPGAVQTATRSSERRAAAMTDKLCIRLPNDHTAHGQYSQRGRANQRNSTIHMYNSHTCTGNDVLWSVCSKRVNICTLGLCLQRHASYRLSSTAVTAVMVDKRLAHTH